MEIFNAPSTQKGCSLPQVVDLSKKIGLNYQMAFREKGGQFVVPSVVHWKAGHYAAMVRQEGDRYLLKDPTFGNTVWATRQALEEETSGYFLIPPGPLPKGWRAVEPKRAKRSGAKAKRPVTPQAPSRPATRGQEEAHPCNPPCPARRRWWRRRWWWRWRPGSPGPSPGFSLPFPKIENTYTSGGMAVSSVHLMRVNLICATSRSGIRLRSAPGSLLGELQSSRRLSADGFQLLQLRPEMDV